MASHVATPGRSAHRPLDAARRLDQVLGPGEPADPLCHPPDAAPSDPVDDVPWVDDVLRADDVPPARAAGASRRSALAGAVVPASLRGARWSVGASAVTAVLVLVAVVGVASAVRTAQASPGVPVPARPDPAATAPSSAPVAAAAAPSGAPGVPSSTPSTVAAAPAGGPGAATVVVHVVGAVAAPGLVTLAAGARVGDALAAAGGAGADADLARVNLARTLVDGEQVVVPRPGEDVAAAPAAPAPGAAAGAGPAPSRPLDLNAATPEQLDDLPGIGPVLAQRILEYRAERGGFTSVGELREVSGIGDAVMADLEPLVRV